MCFCIVLCWFTVLCHPQATAQNIILQAVLTKPLCLLYKDCKNQINIQRLQNQNTKTAKSKSFRSEAELLEFCLWVNGNVHGVLLWILLLASALRSDKFWTARAVVVSKSPCLGKRCCGHSGMQDGAGMRTGRSCFRWIAVGWHSVAIWRSVCCWMSTMVGVRRVLSVSARGIRSQGRLMGCSLSQQNCVCECTEVRWVNDVQVRE